MNNHIRKVVLIGTGAVGSSYAYSMINQDIVDELILIDVNEERAEGEAMDLSHGIPFATSTTRIRNGHYEDCKDADIVVITAGLAQKPGETRLQLVSKNTAIFKEIVGSVMGAGFDGIFLIATNPVDILTYVTWKESGLPAHRVIGSGTTLDSARLQMKIAAYTGVNPKDAHVYMIGEHGDTEVPVWSQARIGVESLTQYLDRKALNNAENLQGIYEDVRDAAYHIIQRKGATYYGVGMALAKITKSILQDDHTILPVSVLLNGEYGHHDVYAGIPSVVNRGGVKEVIELTLSETEQQQLNKSIQTLKEIMNVSAQ